MRVLVVDDQRIVREGLATIVAGLPDTEVVGLAADGSEAVALAAERQPDVVLMDLRMPVLDGVGATEAIRRTSPGIEIVVLTTYADDESVVRALAAGARGYLTKNASRADIQRAIEAAAAGQSVLDPTVQDSLVRAALGHGVEPAAGLARERKGAPVAPLPDGLTEREGEVLALIADGLSNSEIAAQLYVAEVTVKTHVNRIFAKTHSRDRAQAVAYAHRHGLVS